MESETPVPEQPRRRIPWAAIWSLVGSVVLSLGLALVPLDVSELGRASYPALFAVMLLCNATVILPAPGMGAAILAAKTLNPWWVGLVCGLAAGIGEFDRLAGRPQRRAGRRP